MPRSTGTARDSRRPRPRDDADPRLAPLLVVAGRVAGTFIRRVPAWLTDDVRAAAALGAWLALTKRPDLTGVDLERYAIRRMYGTVLDQLRKSDWMPRRMRAENAALTQFSLDQYLSEKNNREAPPRMPEPLVAPPTQEGDAQATRDVEALREALAGLGTRERYILAETYGRERLLGDVAAELGITEPRVSQIRTRAIEKLQETMRARR